MAELRHSAPTVPRQRARPRGLMERTRICEQCSAAFIQKDLSAKQKAAGHRAQFCSHACRGLSRRGLAVPRNRLLTLIARRHQCRICEGVFSANVALQALCSEECRVEDTSRRSRMHSERKDQRDRSPRPCRECGAVFAPEYGNKRRDFCSQICCDAFGSRVEHSKRRPRQAGVMVDSVDPLVVLNRDGWRCYLCGEETPESLRGTWHPRAPEVDHVVPLGRWWCSLLR